MASNCTAASLLHLALEYLNLECVKYPLLPPPAVNKCLLLRAAMLVLTCFQTVNCGWQHLHFIIMLYTTCPWQLTFPRLNHNEDDEEDEDEDGEDKEKEPVQWHVLHTFSPAAEILQLNSQEGRGHATHNG
eukprot:1153099-Pelagomonas_calceolata.AAC.2